MYLRTGLLITIKYIGSQTLTLTRNCYITNLPFNFGLSLIFKCVVSVNYMNFTSFYCITPYNTYKVIDVGFMLYLFYNS